MSSELKRPWYHVGLIVFYSLLPILSLILYSAILQISVVELALNLFDYFHVFAIILLFTSPLIALSLFYVNKNSFLVFVGHNVLLVIYAVSRILEYKSSLDLAMALIALLFASSLVFILHKNFRQPYFNILPRGFRYDKRQELHAEANLNQQKGEVNNLSQSGCFFKFENGPTIETLLNLGQQVEIEIHLPKRKLHRIGEVMRLTLDGAGIRFLEPLHDLSDFKNLFEK